MKYRHLLSAVTGIALLASTSLSMGQEFSSDARFTISLITFEGPGHVKRSKEARDFIKKNVTNLKQDFYLIHEEDRSVIYYGAYKAVDAVENADEAKRAKEDLRMLIGLRVGDQKPFQDAVFAVAPTPDPAAPAEWDIRNAKGVWSLEIASYKTYPAEQKLAAVEAVREARKMGIEAYFYHGPTTSSVLLGVFPLEAVEISQIDEQAARAAAPPDRELLVMPFMPKNIPGTQLEDGSFEVVQSDGSITRIVAPKTVIRDPILAKLMQQYPEHHFNGSPRPKRYKDPVTGKEVVIYAESFLIDLRKIKNDSLLAGGRPAPRGSDSTAADPGTLAPKPTTPGSGKLKQIK